MLDSISKTSIKLLLAEPFYGHFTRGEGGFTKL